MKLSVSCLLIEKELLYLKFCKPCISIFSSLEVAAYNGDSEVVKYPKRRAF